MTLLATGRIEHLSKGCNSNCYLGRQRLWRLNPNHAGHRPLHIVLLHWWWWTVDDAWLDGDHDNHDDGYDDDNDEDDQWWRWRRWWWWWRRCFSLLLYVFLSLAILIQSYCHFLDIIAVTMYLLWFLFSTKFVAIVVLVLVFVTSLLDL